MIRGPPRSTRTDTLCPDTTLFRSAGAPFLPGMHDDLGVADAAEHMAQIPQLAGQILEVVDLAIVDNRDAAVLVVHRLLAAGEVDDQQPAVAAADALGEMVAFRVGTPGRRAVRPRHPGAAGARPPGALKKDA